MRAIYISLVVLAGSLTPAFSSVPQLVHDRATATLGARWAPVAVALARKESGFRCNAVGPRTRQGRAKGVFQVMPASARALGFNYAKLSDCRYGVEAGLAHMRLCIAYGVKTDRQMFSCHLRGIAGWR